MILTTHAAQRHPALDNVLPQQRKDFYELF
jgi:hypothetical protein